MLLLLDFLILEAVAERSIVAFSLSTAFRDGDSPPTERLVRRVVGSVVSMVYAISALFRKFSEACN